MKTRYQFLKKNSQKPLGRFFLSSTLICLCLAFFTVSSYAQVATATINFDQPTSITVPKGAFGLNLSAYSSYRTQADQNYRNAISYMKPGLMRCHDWGVMDQYNGSWGSGWLNGTAWYTPRISSCVASYKAYNTWGGDMMMNIPSWPKEWNDSCSDVNCGKLSPAHYTDFYNWCAQLVQIVNIDNNGGIKYWEITNEQDERYGTNCDELGRIFNGAAAAMKAVDPTIKCGGAAFASPHITANVGAFFSTAAPNLDFVSFHSYSTDHASVTSVFKGAVSNGKIVNGVRSEFAKYSTRAIEYFHNEFNISWAPPDDMMTNDVSLAYDAIFNVTAIKAGCTATNAWNESDGYYGKCDYSKNYSLRPSAYGYHNLNNAGLVGATVCNSTVSDDNKLVVMATVKGDTAKFVAINRSEADNNFQFNFSGLPAKTSSVFKTVTATNTGGSTTGSVTYGELTGGTGIQIKRNEVVILSIKLGDQVP